MNPLITLDGMTLKARCKRTRRGAWIVEYGFKSHATFGELKRAREFANGYNQALRDMQELINRFEVGLN